MRSDVKIQVLIADCHDLIREGLAALAQILVLATFPDDIVLALREGAIDCLLKDMPRDNRTFSCL